MKTRILFFCFALSCTSLFAQVNLFEGLISQYSMDRADWQDQKLLDLVGDNHIYTPNVVSFDDDRNGGDDGAYRFAGNEEIVGLVNEGHNATDLWNLDQISLTFWHVGISWSSDDDPTFFSYMDENGNGFMLNKKQNNGEDEMLLELIQVENSNPIASHSVVTYFNVGMTQWNHFGFVLDFNAGEISLFIDGVKELTSSLEVVEIQNPKIIFGRGESTANLFMNCFDEVHLYNRLLTDDEVFTLSGASTTSNDDLGNTAFDFKILPNPVSSNRVNIALSAEANSHQIELYNELGALLQTKTTSNDWEHLQMNGLVNGVYFVKVKNESSSLTKKIMYQGN